MKKILVLFVSLFLTIFVFAVKADAMENHVDEDGNVLYGWHLETNETDAETWKFDENGNPVASYSAEGDTGNQFTNNYAIRNLKVDANATYTLQSTFTPDSDSDLSVERAYGLLVWYKDPENFLIYWLQQKPGDWSGQFYGRVNNVYKSFYMTQETAGLGNIGFSDNWRRSEFNDMWWDSAHPHVAIRAQRASLITTTVTLKVNSAVENVTVAGQTEESRYFEVYQIVNGTEHLTCKMYIKDVNSTSGDFYTGLYTERFNVAISDFSLVSSTDFAAPVNAQIAELPTDITTDSEMQNVIKVAANYKSLLSYKSAVSAENASKIEGLDAKVAQYVDSRILGLDVNKTTYVDDVLQLADLYDNLPVEYQDAVTKVDALIEALEKAENWEDPTIVKPVVEILTPNTAHTGDVVEVKYNVSDNITSAENLEITVSVKKGVTNVNLTDNKFTAQEGTYRITVSAKDEHGNTGSANLTLTVTTLDTEKPVITITTPSTAQVGDEVEVKYNVTDNASSASDLEVIVSVVKDGAVVNLTNNKFTAEVGTYSITVSAKDAAGNVNSASVDVVVKPSDTTKPTVTITTPETAEVGEEVFVTYTASDDKSAANKMSAVVKVEKDGSEVTVTNNKFTTEAGTYTITVTVTDEAGNSTTATSTLTVAANTNTPSDNTSTSGCGGSIVTSLFGLLSLFAMVFMVSKKRKQN